jgi:hypothetical protein
MALKEIIKQVFARASESIFFSCPCFSHKALILLDVPRGIILF